MLCQAHAMFRKEAILCRLCVLVSQYAALASRVPLRLASLATLVRTLRVYRLRVCAAFSRNALRLRCYDSVALTVLLRHYPLMNGGDDEATS